VFMRRFINCVLFTKHYGCHTKDAIGGASYVQESYEKFIMHERFQFET
jgi:hypothetical protein